MGLKWSVLIYLRLARKREMESRDREEGTIGFEVTADSAGRDSTRGIVESRIVANSSQILPVICGNIIISPLLSPKICRPFCSRLN